MSERQVTNWTCEHCGRNVSGYHQCEISEKQVDDFRKELDARAWGIIRMLANQQIGGVTVTDMAIQMAKQLIAEKEQNK